MDNHRICTNNQVDLHRSLFYFTMASKPKLKASKSDQIVDHSQALEEDIQFSPPEPLSGSPKPTPQGKKSGPTRQSQRISLSREIREGENLLSERNVENPFNQLFTLAPHLQGEEQFSTPGLRHLSAPQLQRSPIILSGSAARLPVEAMNAIKMATRLAPHVEASPNAEEKALRHDAALAAMDSLKAQIKTQQNIIEQQKQMQEVQREAFQAYVQSQSQSVVHVSSSTSASPDQINTRLASLAQPAEDRVMPSYQDQQGVSPESLIFNQIDSSELSAFVRQGTRDCHRCGRYHSYTDQLCTMEKDTDGGTCQHLDPRDEAWRKQTKLLLRLKQKAPQIRP